MAIVPPLQGKAKTVNVKQGAFFFFNQQYFPFLQRLKIFCRKSPTIAPSCGLAGYSNEMGKMLCRAWELSVAPAFLRELKGGGMRDGYGDRVVGMGME